MVEPGRKFECLSCGECCRADMHVFLNPDDLKRMAGALNLTDTAELFERSIVMIDRGRNNAPLPRLRFSKGLAGCCPFLENRLAEEDGFRLSGLCSLHPDSKPLVCSLAPLYRTVDLEAGTDLWGFRAPLPGCPGCDRFGEPPVPEELQAPEELAEKLAAETVFFSKLAEMLDAEICDERIIRELYHLQPE